MNAGRFQIPSPLTLILTETVKCYWIFCVWLLVSLAQPISAEVSFVISQKGMDQLSDYGVKAGLDFIKNQRPINLKIDSKKDPGLEPFGKLRLGNKITLRNLRLLLEKNAIGILIQDFNLSSTADLSAEVWPFPTWAVLGHLGNEKVKVNFSLPQTYLRLMTADGKNSSQQEIFTLKSCTVAKPVIITNAQNYWIVDKTVGLGAKWVEGNFEGLFCGQVKNYIGAVKGLLASTFPVFPMLAGMFPELEERQLTLKYKLVRLDVTEGQMAVGIAVGWQAKGPPPPPIDTDYLSPDEFTTNYTVHVHEGPHDREAIQVQVGAKGVNHVAIWLDPTLLNTMLTYIKWGLPLMSEEVEVKSAKIPERSRKFLTTMCDDCFFRLHTWLFRAPVLIAREGSLLSLLYVRENKNSPEFQVQLKVFNPSNNKSSIFSSFLSRFDADVIPFIENQRLKVKIDLNDITVNLTDAAFPTEWDVFVKDLIQGLIVGMMWPDISRIIEKDFTQKGIPLSPACGFDPASAEVLLKEGRFGFSANMALPEFDFLKCKEDLMAYMCSGECGACGMLCDSPIPQNSTQASQPAPANQT